MGIRVERVMGTVVSLDVRDPDPGGPAGRAVATALDAAVAWLREVDARFSPFRAASEIRRLDRGSLALDDCHPDVRHVLRACEDLRLATDGAFDAWGHREDGALDPSGFVKGWAVDEAADILKAAGARSFAINAGGDIVVHGEPEPGRAWRVGVQDPADAGRVAAVLVVRGGAVATSGLYERGAHIRDPRSGAVAGSYASVTVVGPTLGLADAWATAAFALGEAGPKAVAARPGLGVLAIDHAGVATWSDLVDALLA
ncbi:MAG TPA: FAD:protein FMN transferase [Candidatus Nanopelagicales bacterium]|nr:FAD:protein FMN transferase [Candidatus Nanopelagicales bacterium]